jgi:transcriptional regulator with XRE-family HTH domain
MVDDDGGLETVGALLARVRGDQGISQLRLAERLCAAAGQATVTRHEVSRWEREERIPTPYWLGWLGAVLELPLAQVERAAAVARQARSWRPASRPVRGAPPLAVPPQWRWVSPGVYRRAS